MLVRLGSPGPVLFIQPRLGFNNETINVFKFRTMFTDMTDVGARKTTTKDDPRVTPIGRFLRRFSIDELPQLLNVIQGSMSLVGPRPHGTEMMVGDRFYHEAVRGYSGRHRVKPGITGYAQVNGLRGEVRTIERAKRRVDSTSIMSITGHSGSISGSCSQRLAQFCSTAMRTDHINFLDVLRSADISRGTACVGERAVNRYAYVVTPNVDHLVRIHREPALRTTLRSCRPVPLR